MLEVVLTIEWIESRQGFAGLIGLDSIGCPWMEAGATRQPSGWAKTPSGAAPWHLPPFSGLQWTNLVDLRGDTTKCGTAVPWTLVGRRPGALLLGLAYPQMSFVDNGSQTRTQKN